MTIGSQPIDYPYQNSLKLRYMLQAIPAFRLQPRVKCAHRIEVGMFRHTAQIAELHALPYSPAETQPLLAGVFLSSWLQGLAVKGAPEWLSARGYRYEEERGWPDAPQSSGNKKAPRALHL